MAAPADIARAEAETILARLTRVTPPRRTDVDLIEEVNLCLERFAFLARTFPSEVRPAMVSRAVALRENIRAGHSVDLYRLAGRVAATPLFRSVSGSVA